MISKERTEAVLRASMDRAWGEYTKRQDYLNMKALPPDSKVDLSVFMESMRDVFDAGYLGAARTSLDLAKAAVAELQAEATASEGRSRE